MGSSLSRIAAPRATGAVPKCARVHDRGSASGCTGAAAAAAAAAIKGGVSIVCSDDDDDHSGRAAASAVSASASVAAAAMSTGGGSGPAALPIPAWSGHELTTSVGRKCGYGYTRTIVLAGLAGSCGIDYMLHYHPSGVVVVSCANRWAPPAVAALRLGKDIRATLGRGGGARADADTGTDSDSPGDLRSSSGFSSPSCRDTPLTHALPLPPPPTAVRTAAAAAADVTGVRGAARPVVDDILALVRRHRISPIRRPHDPDTFRYAAACTGPALDLFRSSTVLPPGAYRLWIDGLLGSVAAAYTASAGAATCSLPVLLHRGALDDLPERGTPPSSPPAHSAHRATAACSSTSVALDLAYTRMQHCRASFIDRRRSTRLQSRQKTQSKREKVMLSGRALQHSLGGLMRVRLQQQQSGKNKPARDASWPAIADTRDQGGAVAFLVAPCYAVHGVSPVILSSGHCQHVPPEAYGRSVIPLLDVVPGVLASVNQSLVPRWVPRLMVDPDEVSATAVEKDEMEELRCLSVPPPEEQVASAMVSWEDLAHRTGYLYTVAVAQRQWDRLLDSLAEVASPALVAPAPAAPRYITPAPRGSATSSEEPDAGDGFRVYLDLETYLASPGSSGGS